ncbi:MAG TPA: serine/threonine-protein kinase [Gemmatimonadales bacterium]|nr:serine/threonine-protein kinase [Gemmatimonadales bacterium]
MIEPSYLAPGTVLQDRYEVAQEIGRGGFSVVYRARDRSVGTDVAIKLLVPPPAAARLARERLRREVQAVRQLQHPNIVGVYDVADAGPWSFVVMEYVAGPDLAVRVRDRGALDPTAAARLGREVASALALAHGRGILHRDVKPQNILLAPDGPARLTDFGSARLAGQVSVTQTGGLVGTLAFAAPEVLAGGRGDARADGYALGLTLFYALAGELPSRRAPQTGTPAAGDGYHVRAQRPEVPAWLDAAIAQATAPDPDDRFPAMALFAAALAPDAAVTTDPASGVARDRCVLCRATDPFGLGVCPRCSRRASDPDDVLVFLERTSPGTARRAVLEALEARLGTLTGSADREAVVRGERPLLRVPAAAGAHVVDLLHAHGLPARTVALGGVWRTAVPAPITFLAGGVVVGGFAAALAATAPLLLVLSPAVGLGLVSVAAVWRRTPVWNPPAAGPSSLSPEAEREAVRTVATLPLGEARRLLLDVLRLAGAVTNGTERIGSLVVAACGAARDLASLEQHLSAFDAARERAAAPPAGWLDALSRCEQGRDLLTQRLLETSAALSHWQATTRGTSSGDDDLTDLTRALNDEAQIQTAAAREVAGLLRS